MSFSKTRYFTHPNQIVGEDIHSAALAANQAFNVATYKRTHNGGAGAPAAEKYFASACEKVELPSVRAPLSELARYARLNGSKPNVVARLGGAVWRTSRQEVLGRSLPVLDNRSNHGIVVLAPAENIVPRQPAPPERGAFLHLPSLVGTLEHWNGLTNNQASVLIPREIGAKALELLGGYLEYANRKQYRTSQLS